MRFHVTVRPGEHGVPRRITDIVVVNGGAAHCLDTVTVSAEVVRLDPAATFTINQPHEAGDGV